MKAAETVTQLTACTDGHEPATVWVVSRSTHANRQFGFRSALDVIESANRTANLPNRDCGPRRQV